MIRINLLGVPKPKSKRAAAAVSGGGGPNPALVAVLIGVLTLGGNGAWYWFLASDAKRLTQEKQAAEAERARLAVVKTKYDAMEAKKQAVERRLAVIDDLKARRSGPAELLAMVGDTVNATDAVWLTHMEDDGTRVTLEGAALSLGAVANLISNLQKTEQFATVEIQESYQQDEKKDDPMASFIFQLSCEKKKRS